MSPSEFARGNTGDVTSGFLGVDGGKPATERHYLRCWLMAAAFITLWAGVGILVGAALAPCVRRLLTAVLPASRAVHLTVALLTALTFGALAWRFGHQF